MRSGLVNGFGWLAVGAAIAPVAARGAGGPVVWDPNLAAGLQGGSGLWNTGSPNWIDGSTRGGWNNLGNNTAVFGGAAGGAVQLQAAITAAGVQVDTDGYQIGTAASPTLTLSAGSISAGVDATFLAALVTPSLTKSGAGTVTLGAAGTNGGTVTILGGAIAFAAQANLGVVARPIDLSGGRLQYTGTGLLTLASGRTVNVGAAGGGIDTLAGTLLLGASNHLGGAGLLSKLGAGTLRIASPNAGFGGSLLVIAGALSLEDPAAINGRPITLSGGTLSLRADAPGDFQSGVTVTGDAALDADRLSSNSPVGGSHALGDLTVNGGATLSVSGYYRNAAVHDLALAGSLRLNDAGVLVRGTLSGGGAVLFGAATQLPESFSRGLIFANGSSQSIANAVVADDASGRATVGVDAGSTLTYTGAWQGGGSGAQSAVVLRDGGKFVAGAGARLNTLTNDVTGVRPFTVIGLGTGTNTFELGAGFVADHAAGATVADGFSTLEVRDAMLVTRASASLPVVVKMSGFGGTHRAGGITFSGTAGAKWVVSSATQSYDGGVTFNSSATVQTDRDLTHAGTVGAKFDGQFQIPAAGVTVTKTGLGWLYLSGSQGYAPGATLAVASGFVTFNSDPGAGFYTGNFTRDANGDVAAAPAPAGTLAVTVGSNATVRFAAPVSRVAALSLGIGGAAEVSSNGQAGQRTLVAAVLTIANGGQLDLTDNRLVVDYTGPGSTLASVAALIKSGFNAGGGAAGRWHGSGIVSRSAALDASLAVGYAEASAALRISGNQTGTFGGQTVDATSVLARLTRAGDTNLDGVVAFGDFQRWQHSLGGPGDWYQGDFNYDGAVDLADFVLLYNNYGLSVDSPAAPANPADQAALSAFASAALVPEPGCAVWIGVAWALLYGRRRQRHGTMQG